MSRWINAKNISGLKQHVHHSQTPSWQALQIPRLWLAVTVNERVHGTHSERLKTSRNKAALRRSDMNCIRVLIVAHIVVMFILFNLVQTFREPSAADILLDQEKTQLLSG